MSKLIHLVIILGLILVNFTLTQTYYEVSSFDGNIESLSDSGDTESEENYNQFGNKDELLSAYFRIINNDSDLIQKNKPQILNVLSEQEVYIKYLKPPQLNS